jgi:hypothetical protein
MLELPVAPFLGHLNPAVVRQQPNDIPNLHITITPLLFVESWVVCRCEEPPVTSVAAIEIYEASRLPLYRDSLAEDEIGDRQGHHPTFRTASLIFMHIQR